MHSKFIPSESYIIETLDSIDYDRYLPKKFLLDLFYVTKHKLLDIKLKDDPYLNSIYDIISDNNISYWLTDTINILKVFSNKYDLRVLENYADKRSSIDIKNVGKGFNYKFDLNKINVDIIKFLNISEEELSGMKALDNDVVTILNLASGVGDAFIPSISYKTISKQMETYSSIIHVSKSKLADPLFKYKLSTKQYDIDSEYSIENKSDELVLGYFVNLFNDYFTAPLLMRLFGMICLSYIHNNDAVKITVYSFYSNTYDKVTLKDTESVIEYFTNPVQLKLYPIKNNVALNHLITENKGKDIIFLPNVDDSCSISSGSSPGKIHIVSSKISKFNTQYGNICKKTNGLFVKI